LPGGAEVEHQIPRGVALDHKQEAIHRAAPAALVGIRTLPELLGDLVIKQLLEHMGGHDRGLVFIHLVEFVGLHRAALQHLGIEHIAATEIRHQCLQCVVHSPATPVSMLNPGRAVVSPLGASNGTSQAR